MDIVQLTARIKQIHSPDESPHIRSAYTYLTDPIFTHDSENADPPTTLLSTDIIHHMLQSPHSVDSTNTSASSSFTCEDESDPWTTTLSGIHKDHGKGKTRVYLCIYRQNEHSIMISSRKKMNVPYISFYMEHADHHVSFPSFRYNWQQQPTPDPDNDVDDAETFKTECVRNIIRILDLEQTPVARKHRRRSVDFGYRGVVPHGDAVFAFFDFTHIRRFFHKSRSESASKKTTDREFKTPNSVWAIVDEILNRKKVFSTNVDPRIYSMFAETPVLWHIHHEGEPIAYPRAMYAVVPRSRALSRENPRDCTRTPERGTSEGGPAIHGMRCHEHVVNYKTDRYDPDCVRKSCVRDTPLLAYSDSDIFAERYLFTTKPIPETDVEDASRDDGPIYKRFACFVYQPLILLSTKFAKHRALKDKYPDNFVENIRTKLTTRDDEMDGGLDVEESAPYRKIPCICFTQKIEHHRPTEFWGFIHADLFDEIGNL